MAKKKTDLHCHILPGIDDGAKNTEVSIGLLREELNQGVTKFVFTPHFDSDRITVAEFDKKRAQSLERLRAEKEFRDMDLEFKLGSEVYYTIGLGEMNLEKLCFEGTDYVLIELPTQARPHGLKRTFGNIVSSGYRPIIAHVERYSYMLSNPTELYELIEMGCLAHVNAEALIKKTKATGMVNYLIRHGLVHFMTSDCHSLRRRPPNLKKGFEVLGSTLGEKYANSFIENADMIYSGGSLDLDYVKKPVKLMGLWI